LWHKNPPPIKIVSFTFTSRRSHEKPQFAFVTIEEPYLRGIVKLYILIHYLNYVRKIGQRDTISRGIGKKLLERFSAQNEITLSNFFVSKAPDSRRASVQAVTYRFDYSDIKYHFHAAAQARVPKISLQSSQFFCLPRARHAALAIEFKLNFSTTGVN
jgi:hypothetical protein